MRMRSLSEAEIKALFEEWLKRSEFWRGGGADHSDLQSAFLAGFKAGITNDITEDDE